MTEKVLSIIVPVYNTEIYLKECLDSLLDQGLKGYEIICINDGSTDNSLAVLEEYQKNNPVIKVYSQTNKGLSATRNRGLSLSQGKYIYFMDSDDVLTSNFLSKAIEKMMNQDLEIYSFDAVSFIDCSSDLEKLSDYGREKSYGYYKDGKEFLNELCRSREFLSPVSLNIIDSNLLRNNDISFIEGILHEDEAFTVEILLYASQVFHTNQKGYKRRIRQNSIMTTKKTIKNFKGYYTVFLRLNDLLKDSRFKQNEGLKLRTIVLYDSLHNIYQQLDPTSKSVATKDLDNADKIAKYNNYYTFKSWLRHYNYFTKLLFDYLAKVKYSF